MKLCDACHLGVKKVLGGVEGGNSATIGYEAAAELDMYCTICRGLFERLQAHLPSREIKFISNSLSSIEVKAIQVDVATVKFSVQGWMCYLDDWRDESEIKTPSMLVIPGNTGDKRCLSLAAMWTNICIGNHKRCNVRRKVDYRPPRLLRLDGEKIYLLSGSELSQDTQVSYATLSYCWGKSPTFLKLSDENESELRQGIPLSRLQTMFQDAIETLRGLSLKYIWIDCLCIQQDGAHGAADWETHAVEMRRIYQNCAINIVAESARCPDEPLFQRRTPDEIRPAWVESRHDGIKSPYTVYTVCAVVALWRERFQGTLSKRGWVLQERMMSPRCLVLGTKQLFWECSEMKACEAFPQGLRRTFLQPDVDDAQASFDIIPLFNYDNTSKEDNLRFRRFQHYSIVEDYTQRLLAMPTKDKLVAIAAIMETLNTTPGVPTDDYICGYLRRDLLEKLYWYLPKKKHQYDVNAIGTPQYRAPSWSWAATDHACRFYQFSLKPFPYTSIEDVEWTLFNERNPYGRVSAARLVFRTGLIAINRPVPESSRVSNPEQRTGVHEVSIPHPLVAVGSFKGLPAERIKLFTMGELYGCSVTVGGNTLYDAHLGFDDDAAAVHQYPVYLLPLGLYYVPVGEQQGWLVKGLIARALEKARFGLDAYVRVGTFTMRPTTKPKMLEKGEPWVDVLWSSLERKTVNLL
ncbi:Fc.00g044600.m01.CDS01 [Cosmosporella sp. VM-42]